MSPLWNLAMSSSVWFVNALLILGVIIQILIKGEPVTKPNSEASIEYWKQRQAAETEISRVSRCIVPLMGLTCEDLYYTQ